MSAKRWRSAARSARVGRRAAVSKGMCVAMTCSSVTSAAMRRRSRAVRAGGWSESASAIQLSASASSVAARAASSGVTLRGKTTAWTRAAQMTPMPISSARRTAVSNTVSGCDTLGKPISAAV